MQHQLCRLYYDGPTSNGFYPGDVFHSLHWFAFAQFDGYEDTLRSAFEEAGLDVAAVASDITEVKYFWSRPNLFLDVANRHRLRVIDIQSLPSGEVYPVVAERVLGNTSDDSP